MNPKPPKINLNIPPVKEIDFGNQYEDFEEYIDPRFPEPLHKELDLTIFVDSNHGHDRVTGKSLTGLISFVGRTPVTWCSKHQSAVEMSTYGAELMAMKRAMEEVVAIHYYLRSMGVKVSKPANVFGDNMSVLLSSTDPGSPLKKKHCALAYHFVQEHYAGCVVDIMKVDSKNNYADPFTKALPSNDFNGHIGGIMRNY